MEKRIVSSVLLATIALLFFSIPIVSAQTYSGFNSFADNVKLFFSNGDGKVRLALEIREKEVNSALENVENGNTQNAIKNLENAESKLKIIQEKISLKTSQEVKTSVEEIKEKISKDNLPQEFSKYKSEEEKTQLTAELTEKTYEYCKELAKEDFALMLKEEECNPDTAIPGLEKELEKLKDFQERMFVQLMLEIRSCIDDPGTCNCEANVDIEQKAKCEKMVALAIKCEYKEDEVSCSELKAMGPKKGDSFAESFVPDFLMNLFREKEDMIGYNINHSDGVPEECWDENDKPECKQYDYLKETKDDWDEYGNYIGKRPKNKEPTMQESIPQCFDENNNFLEEKCGKISVIRNEEGLVNYIIEKEIENILDKFENASEQRIIDVNGTNGQTMINEIKEEMNQINNQIVNITYAAGTGPGGESGVVIKGDKQGVVTGNDGNGSGGLKPEVKTYTSGDGTDKNEVIEDGNKNEVNYDPSINHALEDTIDETYDDELAP
ncbi:MAG: hypothetical protein V1660_01505 [archaeon]